MNNNYYQLPQEKQQEIEKNYNCDFKTLVHVKCDEAFSRLDTDLKLAMYRSNTNLREWG